MNKMQYRKDSRSAGQISALGFGCMRFPKRMGRIDREKAEELIVKAFENGVNYFDTAYLYPGSEEVLGEILKKNGLREKVHVATKLPQAKCNAATDFDRYFDIQKQRLKTDYIDYYLLHNITDFVQWEKMNNLGVKEWVSAKKKSGEIRQIGFSFHGAYHVFEKVLDAYEWDFVQIQYNYIHTHYQAGTEGLRYAAEKGIPVIVMEPLLGGKLATLSGEADTLLQKALPGSTAVALALRFVWNERGVLTLLSGMNLLSQLEENLALTETALPDKLTETEQATIEKIKTIFNKNYKIPCTGCNYCMPCPQKINIPDSFEAYNNSFTLGRSSGTFQYLSSAGFLGEDPHYAGDCIECGRCESHCPQQIDIRKHLKAVRRRLEFPGMKIVRFFMTRVAR